ncbi:MAG: MFS transporter [Clostridia bacterium]|nr:MFS transporter [Clostridia bacterium]
MHINKPEMQDRASFSADWGNWALFYGSVFFFVANLFAAIAIFPAYSLAIGSTPFQAGLQNTAFGLAAVLLRLFLGPVMDRQGPKPLMLFGLFSFATTPLLLMLSPSFNMLLVARIYQSIGLAVVLPGISTLIAEMAPDGRIGTYLGASKIFSNLGLLVGPAGALFIIESFGYGGWLIISALTGLVALALLAGVRTPTVAVNIEKIASSWNQIKKALAEKQIYPIIAGVALFSFSYSAVISFAAVHIETSAPGSEAAYFFMILGLTGIVASLAAGAITDRFGHQRVAWPMLIILGIGAAFFYYIPIWPTMIVICAIILGIGIQGSSLVFTAWMIDISRPGLRATTISIQENTIDLFFAVGALTFGLAAQGPGLGITFLVTGILTISFVLPLRRISASL